MKLLYLASAVALLSAVRAQNCAEEFVEGLKCMEPAFQPIIDKLPPPPTKEMMEEKKQRFVACFTSNGCNNPMEVLPDLMGGDMEGLPPEMKEVIDKLQSLGIVGLDVEKIQKLMAASAKCGEKMKDDIEPLMSKCVGGKIPLLEGFKLPENHPIKEYLKTMGPDLIETIHGLDGILPLFGVLGKAAAMIKMHGIKSAKAVFSEKVCDTADKRKMVAECVGKMFDEKIPEDMKCKNPAQIAFHVLETKESLCKQRDLCQSKGSPQCVEAMKKIPMALCSCAGALMSSKWDELLERMKVCVSQETGEQLEIPPPIANGLKQMLGGKMKEACSVPPEEVDPCAEDFCPMEFMMRKMKEGGPPGGPRGHGPPRPGPPRDGPPPFAGPRPRRK